MTTNSSPWRSLGALATAAALALTGALAGIGPGAPAPAHAAADSTGDVFDALGFSTNPEDLYGYDPESAYANNYANTPWGERDHAQGVEHAEHYRVDRANTGEVIGVGQQPPTAVAGPFPDQEEVVSSISVAFFPYGDTVESPGQRQAAAIVSVSRVPDHPGILFHRLRLVDFAESPTQPLIGPPVELASFNEAGVTDAQVVALLAAASGDINGDGYGDLVINSPTLDAARNLTSPVGTLRVLTLNPDRMVTDPNADVWRELDPFQPGQLEVASHLTGPYGIGAV
ncbi:MAG: hypothetical protein LBT54_00400, partial [Bifidobacteriaceae bacterium]|nr:hypothetical protein [Bifidobacteriaceae bacterium]